MAARLARRRTGSSRAAARRPSRRLLTVLARTGLITQGVMYMIIGWLALLVAFGQRAGRADQSGAIRLVGRSGAGSVALWLLAVGFAALALWRLSEAAWGTPGPGGHKPGTRVVSLAEAVIYGFLTFSVLKFVLGLGAPPSSNRQSRDLTATAMHHPGGRLLAGVIGLALLAGGVVLAFQAWRQQFRKYLRLSGASPRVRTAVTWLGRIGGCSRGAVFAAVGLFLLIAAAQARPGQAKGIDATLRALTRTPAGPWLLVLVAIGLAVFGAYSCCEARWRVV